MTQSQQIFIMVAGFYHLGLAVFHVLFWKIFRWRKELGRMTKINGSILQVMNFCLIFGFLAAGIVLFLFPNDLVGTRLGHVFLIGLALFWLARAAGQIVFFGASKRSLVFVGIFLLGGLFSILPLM